MCRAGTREPDLAAPTLKDHVPWLRAGLTISYQESGWKEVTGPQNHWLHCKWSISSYFQGTEMDRESRIV